MRRNLKKAVAFVLTAALAFSTPIATNATKVDAEEAVTEIENSNVSYVNPTEAEDIEGIGWWDATNTKTSNYYLVSGSSVDIFIDKTGEGSGVILETSASTGWFTMNLEGTGDGDFWGELINADTKPYNNNIGFANVSTAKITLTREDGQLNVFITNVEDDSVVADLTLDLTCPDEEVLAFYLMGQWGIFKVGPTLESIKSVDEEVVADEEMIADLRVEKMDSAYSIVFNKLVEDAEYEVLVEDNMGNFILPVDNVINWDDLQFDRIYTVTVIATKDGYVTKTANTSFSKQYEYEQCESKNVLETITGTGWWNGSQQSTSKYYVASGQSIDIYVTNKAGDNGILLETASMDGKYFDVNLQATADADIWGELISSKSGTNWMPFPFLGTVKYTISRYGNILYLTGTNVSTREVLTDITFTLDCSDGEILGFYFMAQDGTFEVAPYCNPIETEYVSGTGWWNGYQQSTSKYYVASGQSVDMYVANTDGNNGIMLETSYDGKYFDLNLQDMMAWGDLIIEQTESDLISFPSLGSAKVTLSREGDYLNVLSTNLEDGTTLCDMTFKLDCPQEEVLGFYLMAQDGSFAVGPTWDFGANFIQNPTAVVVSSGAIVASVENVQLYDEIAVSVNGQIVEDAELVTSSNGIVVTYTYVPTESGTYEFEFIASRTGYPDDVETTEIDITVNEDGSLITDQEMISNLNITKAGGAYSIVFNKLVEGANYEVVVKAGDVYVPVETDNKVKYDNMVDGVEHVVTVTATKDGYVTKTATISFVYMAEKFPEPEEGVERTLLYRTVGQTDLNSIFWTDFASFQIEDEKKYTFVFENHGSGVNNWNNFVMAFTNNTDYDYLTRDEEYVEYAVVRPDNYAWSSDGITGNVSNTSLSGKAITFTNSITDPAVGSAESWKEWLDIITDSDVVLSITRKGSDLLVEATITDINNPSKVIEWTATLDVARANGEVVDPIYVGFTIDGSYIDMKYVDEQDFDGELNKPGLDSGNDESDDTIGDEPNDDESDKENDAESDGENDDNDENGDGGEIIRTEYNKMIGKVDYSTPFWTEFLSHEIKDNKKYTFVFENHGSGSNNWNNFIMVFANQADYANETRGDDYVEYATVRADNYSWSSDTPGFFQPNISLNGKEITFTNSVTDTSDGQEEAWLEWNNIIKDSDVTMDIIRSGSEIEISARIVSQVDKSKVINWTVSLDVGSVSGSRENQRYIGFTVDNSYLIMKYVDEQKFVKDDESDEKPGGNESDDTPGDTTDDESDDKSDDIPDDTPDDDKVDDTPTVKPDDNQTNNTPIVQPNDTSNEEDDELEDEEDDELEDEEDEDWFEEEEEEEEEIIITSLTAKYGAKTITGKVDVSNATVKIKVGSKAYKKATVSGKKFTLKTSKLEAGTKIKVIASADGYLDAEESMTVKGKMKLSSVKIKKSSGKITGKVSVKGATVKIKVGKKKYKKATVKGKTFSFKAKGLKKGTKIVFQITKKNYETLTKTAKIKK